MEKKDFIATAHNRNRYKIINQLPDIGKSHSMMVGNEYLSSTIYENGYNILDLVNKGYLIKIEKEPYEWQKELVGKNKNTVYSWCPQCLSFGVNFPLDNECGNCGWKETITFYDANTINEHMELKINRFNV